MKARRIIAASEKAVATSRVIESEQEAEEIVQSIRNEAFTVASVTEKSSQRSPLPPFITSTLQREAANQLGFAVKKTMTVAQALYEGVEIGAQATGLITYMRTDSTRIAQQAQDEALSFIEERYGKEYLPEKPRVYVRKAKGVQDAHEAIRPSAIERTPESVKSHLEK